MTDEMVMMTRIGSSHQEDEEMVEGPVAAEVQGVAEIDTRIDNDRVVSRYYR